MHKYFIKTPWIIKRFFSNYVWHIPTKEKEVFLTFDDGPHPQITPWVLAQLKQHKAAATFFCIGDNVKRYPEVYRQIIAEGHAVGNHTQNHLNGWSTSTETYLKNVEKAVQFISSNLFRPPYGRIKRSQAKGLQQAMQTSSTKIIMWDVLSADFDISISKEKCFANVMDHVRPGSIVVFHDSDKAFSHLQFVLPKVLEGLTKKEYKFSRISY